MGALSFRLPDTKHQRLKELAEFDLKTQFEILASRGRGIWNIGSTHETE